MAITEKLGEESASTLLAQLEVVIEGLARRPGHTAQSRWPQPSRERNLRVIISDLDIHRQIDASRYYIQLIPLYTLFKTRRETK